MAHYDSVYRAPGAGDDASGVASILEMVRALKHCPPIQRDVIVLFTDGEEAGLLGAEAFAHSHPWMKDAGLILNFEARGNRGPSLLFETSQNNRPLIQAVAHVAPYPIGSSLFYELYKILPNDTDFTVFRPAGIPGLNFAFGEGLEAYHSPLDTPDHLSLASLQHHGSYGLALTRHFGQLDLAALRNSQGDDVFFDWFGSRLVAYSQRWVLPGQILVTLLFAMALLLAFRRQEFSKKRFLFGLLACLVILILLVAAVAAGWWIISFVLAGRRVIGDSPANLLLLSALMLFGACVGMLLLGFFRKRLGQQELSLAALSLWFVLSWILALEVSSGSYLLFWPLLLGLLGNAASNLGNKSTSHQSTTQWVRNLPALAAAILLFAPVIYFVYIFLTLQMISAAATALLLGLFFLISLPTFGLSSISSRGWAAGLLAVAAMVCLGCGVALSGFSSEHPRPDSIVYSLNADDNSAVWISYDRKPDDWTRQFFGANKPASRPMPNYLAGFARPLISTSTPILPLAPPIIENIEHKQEGGLHRLKLRLRSQRKAETLYLRFPEDVQPISAKVAGRDVPVHKGSRFGLTLYAMGDEGVELELAVQVSFRSFVLGNGPLLWPASKCKATSVQHHWNGWQRCNVCLPQICFVNALFVPQSCNRIHSSSASSRDEGGNRGDNRKKSNGAQDGKRIECAESVKPARNQPRAGNSEHDPKHGPDHKHHSRFSQHHSDYPSRRGPQRYSYADLVGSPGNAV